MILFCVARTIFVDRMSTDPPSGYLQSRATELNFEKLELRFCKRGSISGTMSLRSAPRGKIGLDQIE